MKRVTLGKSRVREIRPPGSVRAKAKWLSYSTVTRGAAYTLTMRRPADNTSSTRDDRSSIAAGL
jgi:hypothetical protein